VIRSRTDALRPWALPLLFLLLALASTASAHTWTVEFHTGSSVHAPNTITIAQAGFPLAEVYDARYRTQPFVRFTSLAELTANYYAVRIGYAPSDRTVDGWGVGAEIELLHDRAIYVSGNDPDGLIQRFELTNGLNHVFVNAALRRPLLADERLEWLLRFGAGPVITSPKAVIRGQASGTGGGSPVFYWPAGIGAQAATQVRYYVTPSLALSGELKATTAATNNRIAGGTASATFNGVQFNLGVTYRSAPR